MREKEKEKKNMKVKQVDLFHSGLVEYHVSLQDASVVEHINKQEHHGHMSDR